jgi:hypothetical protein
VEAAFGGHQAFDFGLDESNLVLVGQGFANPLGGGQHHIGAGAGVVERRHHRLRAGERRLACAACQPLVAPRFEPGMVGEDVIGFGGGFIGEGCKRDDRFDFVERGGKPSAAGISKTGLTPCTNRALIWPEAIFSTSTASSLAVAGRW